MCSLPSDHSCFDYDADNWALFDIENSMDCLDRVFGHGETARHISRLYQTRRYI